MSTSPGLYIKGLIKVPPEPVSELRLGLLPTPTALPATEITFNSFYANWTKVPGATGYYLDIAYDPLFTYFFEGGVHNDVGDVDTLLISESEPHADYYYRVRAYNETQVSLLSNTIHVSILSNELRDIDGNIYHSVIIGNREWIVENLRTTHYADGTLIPNLRNATNSELLIGWTNINWDDFLSSGLHISHAEEAAGTYGYAKTNEVALLAGDVLYFDIDITLLSGDLPKVVLYKNNAVIHSDFLVEGSNTLSYAITSNDNYTIRLKSEVSGTEFSASCSMYSNFSKAWIDDEDGAYCWYDNDIAYKTPYGALYNWPAVNNAHSLAYLERGGVQETEWHVPTIADYYALMRYYDSIGSIGANIAGYHLKRPDFWIDGNVPLNDSGFSIVGAGYRDVTGTFSYILNMAAIWSKEEFDSTHAFTNYAYGGNDSFQVNDPAGWGYATYKKEGLSIRLVRDLD